MASQASARTRATELCLMSRIPPMAHVTAWTASESSSASQKDPFGPWDLDAARRRSLQRPTEAGKRSPTSPWHLIRTATANSPLDRRSPLLSGRTSSHESGPAPGRAASSLASLASADAASANALTLAASALRLRNFCHLNEPDARTKNEFPVVLFY